MADTTIIGLTETTSPTKDDVAVIVDNPSTSTPSNRKITLETLHSKLYSNSVQSVTDGQDVAIKQFDGVEVARIHDGDTNSVTSSGTGASTLSGGTGKGGFGFRRPVYAVTAGADDESITLTLQHSGALVKVTGAAHDLDIILPAVPLGCEGFHIDFVIVTSFSGTNNLTFSLPYSYSIASPSIEISSDIGKTPLYVSISKFQYPYSVPTSLM